MFELAVMWEWIAFAVRWVHVITAVAWIGSSFYFIALDLGLRQAADLPPGAHGEEWQVHGGGFYHIRKYLVAPAEMPDHLTWFKWESYSTWLSGAALLMIVYWAGAELYLIDPAKADLAIWQGILISAASLTIGWLVYDFLCKSRLGENPTALMVLLFVLLVAMGWGYTHIFTGRAMMLHLGAFTATIMTANVFFIIMPNQRIVVKDLQEGRTPDPKYGKIAKLRSTHNNYLTLPVIFLMLSNHYPLAFATEYNWLIAALVFLMGVTIRHYFNSLHARKGNPTWTWLVTALLFVAIMWLSSRPLMQEDYEAPDTRVLSETQQVFADAEGFDEVRDIVLGRCSMCHT
ncbi:MAG TPA: urate hydroxylase PuuD, partial [Paracoccaceae bacterium]|nr:urate hydroxylase PuuD [Paracoccaceae bacterium]